MALLPPPPKRLVIRFYYFKNSNQTTVVLILNYNGLKRIDKNKRDLPLVVRVELKVHITKAQVSCIVHSHW